MALLFIPGVPLLQSLLVFSQQDLRRYHFEEELHVALALVPAVFPVDRLQENLRLALLFGPHDLKLHTFQEHLHVVLQFIPGVLWPHHLQVPQVEE